VAHLRLALTVPALSPPLQIHITSTEQAQPGRAKIGRPRLKPSRFDTPDGNAQANRNRQAAVRKGQGGAPGMSAAAAGLAGPLAMGTTEQALAASQAMQAMLLPNSGLQFVQGADGLQIMLPPGADPSAAGMDPGLFSTFGVHHLQHLDAATIAALQQRAAEAGVDLHQGGGEGGAEQQQQQAQAAAEIAATLGGPEAAAVLASNPELQALLPTMLPSSAVAAGGDGTLGRGRGRRQQEYKREYCIPVRLAEEMFRGVEAWPHSVPAAVLVNGAPLDEPVVSLTVNRHMRSDGTQHWYRISGLAALLRSFPNPVVENYLMGEEGLLEVRVISSDKPGAWGVCRCEGGLRRRRCCFRAGRPRGSRGGACRAGLGWPGCARARAGAIPARLRVRLWRPADPCAPAAAPPCRSRVQSRGGPGGAGDEDEYSGEEGGDRSLRVGAGAGRAELLLGRVGRRVGALLWAAAVGRCCGAALAHCRGLGQHIPAALGPPASSLDSVAAGAGLVQLWRRCPVASGAAGPEAEARLTRR
jgi:hypothetical protein